MLFWSFNFLSSFLWNYFVLLKFLTCHLSWESICVAKGTHSVFVLDFVFTFVCSCTFFLFWCNTVLKVHWVSITYWQISPMDWVVTKIRTLIHWQYKSDLSWSYSADPDLCCISYQSYTNKALLWLINMIKVKSTQSDCLLLFVIYQWLFFAVPV